MPTLDTDTIETIFTANTRQIERAIERLGSQQAALAAKNERVFRESNRRIERSASRLNDNLRRALSGAAVALLGRELVELGDTYTNLSNKVAAASEVGNLQGRSLEGIAVGAAEARAKLEPFIDLYSRILRSSKGVITSEQEVLDITTSVAKAFEAGGASAQEYQAGLIQLGQALGSGFLQGDELRSLRENAPLVADAIATEFGVTIGQLKQLGADGKITSEIVIQALKNQSEQISEAFEATTPRATDAAARAYDRLTLALGRFVNESGIVQDGSEATAAAIDFLANNLEAFGQVVVVSGAALVGMLGASAALTYRKNLLRLTTDLQGASKAMAVLNLTTKGFGGPLVIAIGLVTAGLVYLSLQASEAEKKIAGLQGATERAEEALRQTAIYVDQDAISDLGDSAEAATPKVNLLSGALGDVVDALQDITISKFLNDMAELEGSLTDAVVKLEEAKKFRDDARTSDTGLNTLVDPFDGKKIGRTLDNSTPELDIEIAKLQGQVDFIKKQKIEIGVSLFGEGKGGDIVEAAFDGNFTNATDLLRTALERTVSKNTPETKPTTGAKKKEKLSDEYKDALKVVERLRKAQIETFETEEQQIQRLFDLRRSAISELKLSESEAATLTNAADKLRINSLEELSEKRRLEKEKEDEREANRLRDIDRELQAELALVDEVLNARDFAFGRTLELINRQYEANKARIEREIEDEGRLNEALLALREERDKIVGDVQAEALKSGQDFIDDGSAEQFQAEIDRINAERDERIAAIESAYGAEIDLHEAAQARIVEIMESAAERIARLQSERLQSYVTDTGEIFGNLGAILEGALGKNNKAAKAFLAVQKGIQLASITMNIAEGIGKAIKIGFPQNLPIIAGVTAQGAQAIQLLNSARGFQTGGYTGAGAPDAAAGIVHKNEYVFEDPVVRKIGLRRLDTIRRNPDLLRRLPGFQTGGYTGPRAPGLTPSGAPAFDSGRSVAAGGSFSFDGRTNFTGPINSETLPDVERIITDNNRRLLARIPQLLANIVRSGGGELDAAMQSTYGVSRNGF